MNAEKANCSVVRMTRLLAVSRSGYWHRTVPGEGYQERRRSSRQRTEAQRPRTPVRGLCANEAGRSGFACSHRRHGRHRCVSPTVRAGAGHLRCPLIGAPPWKNIVLLTCWPSDSDRRRPGNNPWRRTRRHKAPRTFSTRTRLKWLHMSLSFHRAITGPVNPESRSP